MLSLSQKFTVNNQQESQEAASRSIQDLKTELGGLHAQLAARNTQTEQMRADFEVHIVDSSK